MIQYKVKGSGPAVVLLHGFPLNSLEWENFSNLLSDSCTVYMPDLPGFGNSPLLNTPFSINDVATEIVGWIGAMNIKSPVIVGHSLGGYVALAIAHQQPSLPLGIVLFHSTAYADSDEKKENRNKVIDFIGKNGVEAFTGNFVSTLFANPQHAAVAHVREISLQAKEETVIGYTQAMRDREPRLDVMKDFPRQLMIIAGEKDGGIPVDTVKKQASLGKKRTTHILPDVAHMGMFEASEQTSALIKDFIVESNRP